MTNRASRSGRPSPPYSGSALTPRKPISAYPLMRVKDGNSYVLVGSQGGAPTDPVWVHNLRVDPDVEIRDETVVRPMRVREVEDEAERSRLWKLAIAAYSPYAEYQERTARRIPVFVQSSRDASLRP